MDAAPLVLAGCGKMGGALLAGWLDRGIPAARIVVVEPSEAIRADLAKNAGLTLFAAPESLPADLAPAAVLLAVKPQTMDAAVGAYRRFAERSCIISIAAGKSIAYFERNLGPECAILRAMPNTPAAVRRGITVVCANRKASADQRALAADLLGTVGAVEWIADERLMDAVTAVSGSGPAYVFLLAEALAEAGAKAGLPADLAAKLARATVAGAGELLHRAPDSAATLRANVTSPGGTTAEALKVLMGEKGWQPVLDAAIAAATRRSRELGS